MHNPDDANAELQERLTRLLIAIWNHAEIEEQDMRLLCYGCGIPFDTINQKQG